MGLAELDRAVRDELDHRKFTERERRVVVAIARASIHMGRPKAWIPKREHLCVLTGMTKGNLSGTLRRLVRARVLEILHVDQGIYALLPPPWDAVPPLIGNADYGVALWQYVIELDPDRPAQGELLSEPPGLNDALREVFLPSSGADVLSDTDHRARAEPDRDAAGPAGDVDGRAIGRNSPAGMLDQTHPASSGVEGESLEAALARLQCSFPNREQDSHNSVPESGTSPPKPLAVPDSGTKTSAVPESGTTPRPSVPDSGTSSSNPACCGHLGPFPNREPTPRVPESGTIVYARDALERYSALERQSDKALSSDALERSRAARARAQELLAECLELFGRSIRPAPDRDYTRMWAKACREKPEKVERILATLNGEIREGKTHETLAGCAATMYRQWAD